MKPEFPVRFVAPIPPTDLMYQSDVFDPTSIDRYRFEVQESDFEKSLHKVHHNLMRAYRGYLRPKAITLDPRHALNLCFPNQLFGLPVLYHHKGVELNRDDCLRILARKRLNTV